MESVYDAANRLTSVNGVPYTWDNNGNLLSDGVNTYTYDKANRLVSVTRTGTTSSYQYNGLGDRVNETNNGVITNFTLDLNTGLTHVLADGTNTYLYGTARIGQFTASDSAYFLGDALGSVRQLVSGVGAVTMTKSYKPYGEVLNTVGSGKSNYGYTNEYTNQGQIYLRARWYAPTNGRFLTRDMWEGNFKVPMSYNIWLYVYANPIRLVDPSGRMPGCEYPYEDCPNEWNTFERFDIVLTYMHQEMITNAQSPTVGQIKDILTCQDVYRKPVGDYIGALALWAFKVRPGGDWDHKPKLAKMVGLKAEGDYYFPIRGDNENEYYYDIWSNIHYGFVGAAAGFDLNTLNDGASVPFIAGRNDQGDILSVTIGFELWKANQLRLTSAILREAILSNRDNYIGISERSEEEVKRVITWTNGH